MGSRIYECKFMKFPENDSEYRFYHKEKEFIKSRNAGFVENVEQLVLLQEIKLLRMSQM